MKEATSCRNPSPGQATTTAEKTARSRLLIAGWMAHATTRAYQRRVDEARRIVERALEIGRSYLAISGGKDSVALLGIARSVDPSIDAWFIDSGAETPDTMSVIERLATEFGVRIKPASIDIVTMLKMVGAMGYDGPEKLDGEWHWSAAAFKQSLIEEPAQALAEEFCYRVAITGVRADESRGRAIMARKYGPLHQTKSGMWSCMPLINWRGIDSLAYCAAHDLPISHLYIDPDHSERPERRRTGCMLGTTYRSHGRWAELRAKYPEAWRRLEAIFPDMRRLT